MAYLTGVSKFSKIGVFSATNNIVDCSAMPAYCTMFGYIHDEISDKLYEYVLNIAEKFDMKVSVLLEKMKVYYDGYTFCNKNTVYNPISVLSFFLYMQFKDYWVETGSQEFIAKYMSSKKINVEDFDNSNFTVNLKDIDSPGEITNQLEPALYLYQAGYLTPRLEPVTGRYYLTYPNLEVRSTMFQLVQYDFFRSAEGRKNSVSEFLQFITNDDYVGVLVTFNQIFSGEKLDVLGILNYMTRQDSRLLTNQSCVFFYNLKNSTLILNCQATLASTTWL
ncbi:MAG: AAA family ATPase [Desulfovibrio sp.]|nr:AAA family ATPase [Desulfovibrio sp.]